MVVDENSWIDKAKVSLVIACQYQICYHCTPLNTRARCTENFHRPDDNIQNVIIFPTALDRFQTVFIYTQKAKIEGLTKYTNDFLLLLVIRFWHAISIFGYQNNYVV